MTTYAKLKVSDLEEAWESECSEVRDVLKRLYPTLLPPPTGPPESKEENITMEMDWKLFSAVLGSAGVLRGFYKGEQIAFVNPTHDYDEKNGVGIRILQEEKDKYEVRLANGHTFRVFKKA